MTGMEALKEVRWAGLRMEALAQRRQRCLELEECVTPGQDAGLRRLRRELDARAGAYAEQVAEAERRIDAVEDGLQRDVLRFRYLNGWSWREIAARTGLSQDWLKHVHAKAAANFGMKNGDFLGKARKDTFWPG